MSLPRVYTTSTMSSGSLAVSVVASAEEEPLTSCLDRVRLDGGLGGESSAVAAFLSVAASLPDCCAEESRSRTRGRSSSELFEGPVGDIVVRHASVARPMSTASLVSRNGKGLCAGSSMRPASGSASTLPKSSSSGPGLGYRTRSSLPLAADGR